jgi:iron complex transport system substrate-binding protein
MYGHPRPRRSAAGPDLSPSRRRPRLPLSSRRPTRLPLVPLALILVLMVALGAALALSGCGSNGTTSTTAASTGTTAPGATETTAAPNETTATTAPSAGTTATTAAQGGEGVFPVTLTDDNGNSVTVKSRPIRIVSTAPAGTEILFAIGAGDRVVGVTSLDDYPPEAKDIAKIGDFQANTEAIMALSPDLVVGYSGNEEALTPVQKAGAPVLILNPTTLDQIYANIEMLGKATGETGNAAMVVDTIKAQVKEVTDVAAKQQFSPKVFYALDNTLWTAGPGSFVDELLKLVGATNVGSMPGSDSSGAQAYYQFAPEQLIAADPDVILLPNTAYKSIDEFVNDPRFAKLSAVQDGHVYLINDTIVTRPGPRIGEGLKALFDAVQAGSQ